MEANEASILLGFNQKMKRSNHGEVTREVEKKEEDYYYPDFAMKRISLSCSSLGRPEERERDS